MFTHLKHMDLSKLYHVGFLDQNNLSSRPVVSFSLEGSGLSVSLHPRAWTQIAQLGGSNLYVLQKDSPKFFMAYEEETDKAISWAIENDYIIPAKKRGDTLVMNMVMNSIRSLNHLMTKKNMKKLR